jgi:hypothetical protein
MDVCDVKMELGVRKYDDWEDGCMIDRNIGGDHEVSYHILACLAPPFLTFHKSSS